MTRYALFASSFLSVLAIAAQGQAQPLTGLYIGAGGGANWLMDQPSSASATSRLVPAPAATFHQQYKTGFAALASIGYGFGNGLRVQLEGDDRFNRQRRVTPTAPTTFVSGGGSEEKYGPMVDVLYDFPIPFVLQPYVGMGLGYQWTRIKAQEVTTTNRVMDQSFTGGTSGSFAYQAIAGAALPISGVPGLALTAEYRFMGLADNPTYGGPSLEPSARIYGRNTLRVSNDFNNSVMAGLRYAFNAAPPPPPAAAAAVPPAPAAARTYLVFFDWDRADLTERARQIIAEAAQATTRVQVTRIQVNGYTDRSGTVRYNQGLSVRRAQNVANELARLGVPRAAISVHGFGESNPLVPTADGVREPQNRRVEIILG